MKTNGDHINWVEQAIKSQNESIETAKFYIDSGIGNKQALQMVLDETCVGKVYRDQIIHTIEQYSPKMD